MKLRLLLLSFALSLFAVPIVSAQLSSDPNQNRLAINARLSSLTQSDLKTLTVQAASGDPEAEFWLSLIYAEGRLVPQDFNLAKSWMLKAGEQGYIPAQEKVGAFYGRGEPESERWLLRTAEQGDADAQLWLGVAYEQNWYGTTDIQEAGKWYRKSAEQGNPDAQVSLGQMYESGQGLEQNYALAAEWYRKAAEHVPDLGGAGQGRNQLGLLYMEGLGVPKDYVQAYMWFSVRSPDNPNLEYVESLMTPAQILAAQMMAAEWQSRHSATSSSGAICTVTPAPSPAFIPPAPYPPNPPSGSFWFGTEKLWTLLRADGTRQNLPHSDSGYGQKLFWWREGYDWTAEPQPKLTVNAKRLDASAPAVRVPRASNGYRQADWKSFMVVGIDIPTAGCWEITGRYGSDELKFVVRVVAPPQ